MASQRRALVQAYNARELMRRSVKVTTWILHGLLDSDNVKEVLRYEVRSGARHRRADAVEEKRVSVESTAPCPFLRR